MPHNLSNWNYLQLRKSFHWPFECMAWFITEKDIKPLYGSFTTKPYMVVSRRRRPNYSFLLRILRCWNNNRSYYGITLLLCIITSFINVSWHIIIVFIITLLLHYYYVLLHHSSLRNITFFCYYTVIAWWICIIIMHHYFSLSIITTSLLRIITSLLHHY